MKQLFCFSIIITTILFSCDKKDAIDNQTPYLGVNIDHVVDLYFEDSEGNDLLDTLNEYHYDSSEIKLLNLIDGEIIEFRKVEVDGSVTVGFHLYKRDDINSYCIRLQALIYSSSFDKVEENNIVTFKIESYLQLNEHETDTIICEIVRKESEIGLSSEIMKVWYNNELKWEQNESYTNISLIKIIK